MRIARFRENEMFVANKAKVVSRVHKSFGNSTSAHIRLFSASRVSGNNEQVYVCRLDVV